MKIVSKELQEIGEMRILGEATVDDYTWNEIYYFLRYEIDKNVWDEVGYRLWKRVPI